MKVLRIPCEELELIESSIFIKTLNEKLDKAGFDKSRSIEHYFDESKREHIYKQEDEVRFGSKEKEMDK